MDGRPDVGNFLGYGGSVGGRSAHVYIDNLRGSNTRHVSTTLNSILSSKSNLIFFSNAAFGYGTGLDGAGGTTTISTVACRIYTDGSVDAVG